MLVPPVGQLTMLSMGMPRSARRSCHAGKLSEGMLKPTCDWPLAPCDGMLPKGKVVPCGSLPRTKRSNTCRPPTLKAQKRSSDCITE